MSLAVPSEAERLARATALFRHRQFADAALAFAEAASASPSGTLSARAVLGEARARWAGCDAPAARDAARRAASLDPDLVAVPLLLARIAAADGNRARAITHLRRAASLRPASATLRARIAALLADLGRTDEALAAAREALAADPDCEGAALVVARCHLSRGNPTLARLAVARLARQHPDHPALASILGAPPVEPRPERAPPAAAPPEPQPALRAAPASLGPRAPSPLDHLAIIRACMLRGLAVKYAGNSFWLPLELVRPTCVVAAHWLLFAVLHKAMPAEIPIPLFVLAGFSVWFAFNYAAIGAANAVNHPAGAIAWPGVTPTHLRLARASWPLLVNLTFCLLATLPFRLVRADLPVPNLPMTFLVFAVAGAAGVGYGTLAERLTSVVPAFAIAEKLISWLLFVTCGLYFVVYDTTPLVAKFLLYNPLLHLIDFERHAFDPGYPIAYVDLRYPVAVAFGLLLLGLAAGQSVRRPAGAAP